LRVNDDLNFLRELSI